MWLNLFKNRSVSKLQPPFTKLMSETFHGQLCRGSALGYPKGSWATMGASETLTPTSQRFVVGIQET